MHVPVTEIAKGLRSTISNNSPAIMTAVAVTGTISTAFLAGKASFKACREIENYGDESLDKRQKFVDDVRLVWKFYIPAVASSAATIACIIGANTVSTRRNAALISAYSLTETAFREYKDKVVETIGEKKSQKIHDEIAKDHIVNTPLSTQAVIVTGDGEVLCFETLTGRYFKSSMETLRKAQNDINSKIINGGYATQNDFCILIGLPSLQYGDEVGWNTSNLLELEFSSHLAEGSRPCLAVGYSAIPVRDYYSFH